MNEFSGEPPGSMRNKERGSTNYLQCGWCEHASGSHRFNYCISGSCGVLSHYVNRRVEWDTECLLKDMSKSDIGGIVRGHEYQIKCNDESTKRHKSHIKTLAEFGKRAPERPPLPGDRPHDYFNIGDRIAIYMSESGGWRFGEVAIGYRHHDGCVSYKLDGFGPQESGFWGVGVSIPEVMREKEYKFFAHHPKEYAAWCKYAYEGIERPVAPIVTE